MMLLAAAAAAIAGAIAPAELELGARLELHGGRCYRVTLLDTGPAGEPYAWLLAETMPRGVAHLPVCDLARAPRCRE